MSALYDSKTKTMNDFGIRQLLTTEAQQKAWLEVEVALAQSQAQLGIIPAQAALDIAQYCTYEALDKAYIEQVYRQIGHGFMPFLKGMIKACPPESGKYIHFGATTQNIQQSARLLVTKRIHQKLMHLNALILKQLATLAEEHRSSVMAGRTHGRHAEPITYGYKVAVWLNELIDAMDRLQECEKRVFRIMTGGAVGSFNSLPEQGQALQSLVAQTLQMGEMAVPSRNIASHKLEYITNLAALCNVFHKMAEEVFSTGIEEFGEVAEGQGAGTVGSSTMPHKRNPKLSKGIIANSQKLYALSNAGLFSTARPFEGDSSSYMLVDNLFEDAIALTIEVVLRAEELSRSLHIDKERLYANVAAGGGLDNSEYIMMKLAERVGRDTAHHAVYEAAMAYQAGADSYLDLLRKQPLVGDAFTEAELQEFLKPENYIGLAPQLAMQQATKARAYAKPFLLD